MSDLTERLREFARTGKHILYSASRPSTREDIFAAADRIEELEAELANARQDIYHLRKYLGAPAHVEEWEE